MRAVGWPGRSPQQVDVHLRAPRQGGHPSMPGRARWVAVPLVMVLWTVAACDVALSGFREEASDTWTKSYPLSEGGTVEIVNTNGFVDVSAGTGSTVEVTAVRVARAATPDAAKELLAKVTIREEVSPDRVKLGAEYPRTGLGGGGVEVRYTVKVPASAQVALTTTNGRLSVTDVKGPATLGTTNGEISARNLGGPVKASTTNGAIDLQLASLAGDVDLETTNGSISLTLPADAKASLSARCTNGSISVDGIRMEELERSRRRLEARLNGGDGPKIALETTNGGIEVRAG
ncbi:MAG TPA: DUF4097 family beta strand repeat-containing protein [Vicinamibacterales bacterium]